MILIRIIIVVIIHIIIIIIMIIKLIAHTKTSAPFCVHENIATPLETLSYSDW